MVETRFTDRLDAALAMNSLDNATFAALLGANGQQSINGWRRRGRIGQPSVAKVRALLPRTNMDWLQEGTGEPERLIGVAEPSPTYGAESSYVMRPNLHTLAAAVRVIAVDEGKHGRYSPLRFAAMLVAYYDRLASGEQQIDLIEQVLSDTSQGATRSEHNPNKFGSGAA